MAYTVWHLGKNVAEFFTRDGALFYVRAHLADYDDYEITDDSDAL
jgi:hypothetical protein